MRLYYVRKYASFISLFMKLVLKGCSLELLNDPTGNVLGADNPIPPHLHRILSTSFAACYSHFCL